MKRTLPSLLLVLAAYGAASAQDEDVTVRIEVAGTQRAKGTLHPASERERYTIDAPRGSKLSASVKRVGKKGTAMSLALTQGGDPVPDAVVQQKGTGATLKPLTIATSDTYEITVAGDGSSEGAYDLRIVLVPPTKMTFEGAPTQAADNGSAFFAAVAGSKLKVDVRPAAGSGFVADLFSLDGGNSDSIALSGGATASGIVLPSTGEWVVNFRNTGATGAWKASFKITPPKLKPRTIDIRDGKIAGSFSTDHAVVGGVVGPQGGTVIADAPGTALEGASIAIPPGSLSLPTVITIAPDDAFAVGDGVSTAGTPLQFGPGGLVFDPTGNDPSKQATITIPFNPAFFPNGTANLRIYVQDADGDTVLVDPSTYVIAGSSVTFPAAHFSTFAVTTTDPPPITGRFRLLGLESGLEQDFSGQFAVSTGTIDDGISGPGILSFFGENAGVKYTRNTGSGPGIDFEFDGDSFDATSVATSPTSVDLVMEDGTATLRRGRSLDVLVLSDQAGVLFRRDEVEPTVASLAGRWHLFAGETRGELQDPQHLNLEINQVRGDIIFAADGKATSDGLVQSKSECSYPDQAWEHEKKNLQLANGSVSRSDGETLFTFDEEGGPPISLESVLDGQVMFGRRFGATAGQDADVLWMVFVRASTDAKPLTGNLISAHRRIETQDPSQSQPVPRVSLRVGSNPISVASGGIVTIPAYTEMRAEYDDNGTPVETLQNQNGGTGPRLRFRKDGTFTLDEEPSLLGAFTPSGNFGIIMSGEDGEFEVEFLVILGSLAP